VGVLCEQIALEAFELRAELFFLIEFDTTPLLAVFRLFARLLLRDVLAISLSG